MSLQEPETPAHGRFTSDLEALHALLDAPRAEERDWRVSVWEHLIRLEHAGEDVVLRGWEALAASGADPDRANLMLYQRRQGLPRVAESPDDGVELTLERCLAAWGDRDLARTRALLQAALQRFPQDTRLRENLLWLDLESPEPVLLDGSARHLGLAVLAARRTRG
jgi:hypothetical protein